MEEEEILKNIPNLKAEQLWELIKNGNTTLAKIVETGLLDLSKRNKILQLKFEWEKRDNEMWQEIIDKKSRGEDKLSDYTDYIANFPRGIHRSDADHAIAEILFKEQAVKGELEKKIKNIKDDRNYYRPETIKQDIDSGIISDYDLINCKIPFPIIQKVRKYKKVEIRVGKSPKSIPEGFTEVYFWGVLNSGKTCALSALLKTADDEKYLKTGFGTGLRYLNDLKDIFREDIGILPEGTNTDNIQYLPFTLQNDGDKFPRSVALIELSGEVFQCFVKDNELDEIPESLKSTYETLTSYLKGNNRKIHFFFIDYNATAIASHNRSQSDYMTEAMKWIEINKVFANNTDAIYLVITKSDLIYGYYDTDKSTLEQNIDFFLENNFPSFRKNLENICSHENINNQSYEIIPFSIGEVYFKRICKIDKEPSKRLIKRLLKIKPQKRSILDVVIR